ncbi:MAG: L-threonylcarbamoyladenylate synthase [Candidatus Latescibacterota bacterium]|nr:MAG: L-threonylcarbamoyladenylate synthase [Candidatus Latescibacterota bacterium]
MHTIDSNRPDAASILAATLHGGGVAVVPTDTIYGLSTPLSSREGYQRVLEIKRCVPDRRFLHLAGSVDMVRSYIASWGCGSKDRLAAIWPAPLTGVFCAGDACPDWVGDTIAFRIPALGLLTEAVNILDEPIVSTSVNITGEAPLNDFHEIAGRLGEHVDLLVDGGPPRVAHPSTIVDFTGTEPVVIRAGAYDWAGEGNPSNGWSL